MPNTFFGVIASKWTYNMVYKTCFEAGYNEYKKNTVCTLCSLTAYLLVTMALGLIG